MKLLIQKTASVLIALCLVAGVICVPIVASAAPPVQLTVTNAEGSSGQDVTVSLNISADSTLAAIDFILKYDSTKLLYKSNASGVAAAGALSSINPNYKTADDSDALKGSLIHVDGITAGGSLLDVTFTVAPGWSGTTPVSLEVEGDISDSTYNSIPFETKNGTVTVDEVVGSSTITAVEEKEESTSSPQNLTNILIVIGVLSVGIVLVLIIVKKMRSNK